MGETQQTGRFQLIVEFPVDDFTPSGSLCYFKKKADSEAVMMLPTTPLQELFNLRWYIQHIIDQCESDSDDDDLDNPRSKDNW